MEVVAAVYRVCAIERGIDEGGVRSRARKDKTIMIDFPELPPT